MFDKKQAATEIVIKLLPSKLPPITGGETTQDLKMLRAVAETCVQIAVDAANQIDAKVN